MRRLRNGFLVGGGLLALAGAAAVGQSPYHTVLRASATEVVGGEAAVALDWAGPPALARGQSGDYTLTVRNVSGQPAQKVVVQLRSPDGGAVRHAAPAAKVTDGVHVWELGTLDPQQSVPLRLTVAAERKGDMSCRAWVTFTGGSAMTVAVTEPKLQMTIDAPADAVRGESVPVRYTVTNVGDGPATSVRHAPGADATKGDDVPMRTLAPGESVSGTATVRAAEAGQLFVKASALADGGLAANAEAVVKVKAPKLRVDVAGPSRLKVGKKGEFEVTVTNTGDAVARTVEIDADQTDGVRDVVAMRDLAPGESRAFRYQWSRGVAGVVTRRFVARFGDGESAAGHLATAVEGAPALRMELVDLADPVEKGEATTYEIRVTNTGTQSDTNLAVQCPLPESLRFVSASGPAGSTVEDLGSCTVVRFGAVRELAPKTDAVFRVTVKPTAAGDQRFRAQLTSDGLTTSVTKEESTRVVGE